MVRDDDADTLELHIRVNGQDLSAIPEKCNTSTLRLPSDPSWPKIPLRRLTGNTDGIIKPPCVVTVTGTPRRNRSTVQTIAYQYPMSRKNKMHETSTHAPERLPGCVDPRFKRQVLRQKAEKPDEFCNANQTQMRQGTSHECQRDSVKREEVAGDVCTVSTNLRTCTSKESEENAKDLLNIIQQHNAKSMSEGKNISHCEGEYVSNWTRDKENVDSNIPTIPLDRNHYGNLNTSDNVDGVKSCGISANLNIGHFGNVQARKNDSRSSHASQRFSRYSALSSFERKASSEKPGAAGISESRLRCSCVMKANVSSDEMLREDTQVTDEVCPKEKNVVNSAKLRHMEVRCSSRRKTAKSRNLSQKAKSFFRKRSRLATTNSDCTLMLPGPRRTQGKQYRYDRARDRLKINQLSRRRNWMNSIRVKSSASKRGRMNRSRLLANLRANNPFEQPSSISLKTQQLLNKSYWDYYRKLRRKIASAEPTREEKRSDGARSRANLPASRTLQQCSVLSCVINNALDASRSRALRDPAAAVDRTFSITSGLATCENVCEAFRSSSMRANRTERKQTDRTSKRLLDLKAIAFLVILVYGAIILLPTVYDYLVLDEEHDDCEDVSYIAWTFEYIASSFEQAFEEIVHVLSTVLPRLVSFNREM